MDSMDELRSPPLPPTSPAVPIIVFLLPSMLPVLQLLETIRCPEKPRAAQDYAQTVERWRRAGPPRGCLWGRHWGHTIRPTGNTDSTSGWPDLGHPLSRRDCDVACRSGRHHGPSPWSRSGGDDRGCADGVREGWFGSAASDGRGCASRYDGQWAFGSHRACGRAGFPQSQRHGPWFQHGAFIGSAHLRALEPVSGGNAPVPSLRVLWLYRWPIFLADADRQGDWPWDFGASAAGANSMSRTG